MQLIFIFLTIGITHLKQPINVLPNSDSLSGAWFWIHAMDEVLVHGKRHIREHSTEKNKVRSMARKEKHALGCPSFILPWACRTCCETLLGMSHWAIFLNNFLFRIIQTSYHNLFKFSFPFLRWVCRQDFLILFSFAHYHVDLNV